MAEVDEKVVSMRFDNRQFEQGVSQSINTLNKLKDSLNLDKSAKSLEALEKQASKFDASGINRAAESAGKAFSAMGQMGFSVINRLSNDIISLGQNIARNLTAPIRQGMQTYEQQIKATQTTMNALNLTGEKGEEQVRLYLKDLNKYSDETIYRFSDMTTSLAKFVSAGVDINDATEAIKGLGNVAALSGADTMQFSRAIYNISQSLGMGKMITRDWMSIENANMATKEFKETLLDTAKQMGYMDKQGKLTKKGLSGVSKTQQKTLASMNINYKNFRDSLSGGWLKNDVLMAALKRYADETDTLGKKGKAAATEVKTFTQLLDTLGDSLATKWSNIYTNMIGNFNEAKEFWTGVNNVLESVLVKPLERIDKITSKWKELGGRTSVIQSLQMQLEGLKTAFSAIKDGWEMVFPPKNQVKGLQTITDQFRQFSYNVAHFLIVIAKPLGHMAILAASVTKLILRAIEDISIILSPVIRLAGNIVIAITKVLGALGDLLLGVNVTRDSMSESMTLAQRIGSIIAPICDGIGKAINFVADSISNLISKLKGNDDVSKEADKATATAEKTEKKLNPFLSFLKQFGKFFINIGKLVGAAAMQLFSSLDNTFSGLNKVLTNDKLTPIERLLQGFAMLSGGAGMAGVVRIINNIANALANFGDIGDRFGKAISKIGNSISFTIRSFANKNNAEALKTFAVSVTLMAASLAVVSAIKPERLAGAVGAIGLLCAMLLTMFGVLQKLTTIGQTADKAKKGIGALLSGFAPSQVNQAAKAMIALAAAVAIMAGAITAIGQLDYGKMAAATGLVTGMMFALVGVIKLMGLAVKSTKGFMSASMAMINMAMAISILAKSIQTLGTMPINQLVQGGIAVGVMLVSMVGIIALLGQAVKSCAPQLAIFSASMLMLAPAILVISAAFAIFSAIPWDSVLRGIVAIGAVMAMLTGVSAIMAAFKPMMASMPILAASMLLLAPALVTLAAAFVIFNAVDWSAVAKGVVAIGALMGVMALISGIMSVMPLMMAGMPILAASLSLLAPAVVLIATAMTIFSKVSWGGVLKGIASMAAFMAFTAVFGTLSIVAGPGAKAMLIMSSAIVVLSSAMMVFSQVAWGGVLKGVTTMLAFMVFTVLFGTLAAVAGPGAKATLIMASALVVLSTAFIGFSNVKWGGVAKGLTVMLSMVGVFVALSAAIAFVPQLIVGMLAVVALLKVISLAFSVLSSMNLATLGETFVIFCKKLSEGILELAKAGKDGKKGIEEAVKALMTVANMSARNYAHTYYSTGAALMRQMAAGMLSQRPAFDIGLATVGNSILNFASTGGATAYNVGGIVGGRLVAGFRGPRGLDDPPEESKATRKGTDAMNNTIANATSYLVPTAENTGSLTGSSLANSFGLNLENGTDQYLAEFDAKIAAAQDRAERLNNTRNWVAANPDAIGKNVYSKKKNGVQDEWVKRGDMYYHYLNGNMVGAQKKTPKGVKTKKLKNTSNLTPTVTPASTGSSSGSKKKGSKGSKTVKAADWGNASGYKPDKNGLWNWDAFWKGFNAYSKNGNAGSKAISKWNKALKTFNDYSTKINKHIDPKKTYPKITEWAKIATGANTDEIKKLEASNKALKKQQKTAKSQSDKHLLNAAAYSDKADNAKTKKEKAKWEAKSTSEIKKANKEQGKVATIQKQIDANNKKIKADQKDTNKLAEIYSGVFAKIYKGSAEYKKTQSDIKKYTKDAKKQEGIIKQGNTDLKKANKLIKQYKKSSTAEGKARLEAAKKYKSETESTIKTATTALNKDTDKVKELNKTLKDGPNKTFNDMWKNVKSMVREATKFSTLFNATSGENIFEHFQYNGTKREFESGKMGWRLAGYAHTQNEYYKDLKENRDYILNSSIFSDKFKEYIRKNWKSLGNEMMAIAHANLEDQKKINDEFTQMTKDDADAGVQNYRDRIETISKWKDKLIKVSQLSYTDSKTGKTQYFSPKAIKQILDEGYSEETDQLLDNILTTFESGTDDQKQDYMNVGTKIAGNTYDGISAGLMEAYGYSAADPEKKKMLAGIFGWTDETQNEITQKASDLGKITGENFVDAFAKVISDYVANIGSVSSDTYKKLYFVYSEIESGDYKGSKKVTYDKKNSLYKRAIANVLSDVKDADMYQAGVYLTQGLINGTLDSKKLKELSSAAKKTGHITLDTIAKICGIASPSKVTYEYGQYIVQGLVNGINDGTESIKTAAQNSGKAILTGYGALAQIDTSALQPTVAPVLDMDTLSAQFDQISGFMTDTTANLASQIENQLDMNKAIAQFNASVDYDDSNLISEIESLHSDMMQLQNVIASMQVTLDSSAIVGQITPQIDKALGQRATLGRR